jgi:hypothetical protein
MTHMIILVIIACITGRNVVLVASKGFEIGEGSRRNDLDRSGYDSYETPWNTWRI